MRLDRLNGEGAQAVKTIKCKCGRKARIDLFPYRCLCGAVYDSATAEPRQFAPLNGKPKDDGIPCEHRGEQVERIKCGCQGTQYTYRCSNPAVESGLCILRYMEKMPKEYKDWPTCLFCTHRTTGQSGS